MSNEIYYELGETGQNIYAVARDAAGNAWNGSAYAPYTTTRTNFDIPMTEEFAGTGFYGPIDLPAGGSWWQIYRSTGTPAHTDQRLATGYLQESYQAEAKTWYIAASGGSDSNSGLTRSLPFATLAHAFTTARPFDTIWFLTGNYARTAEWDVSTKPLIIRGDGVASAITITTTNFAEPVIRVGSNSTVSDLRLICANKGSGVATVLTSTHNVTVERCWISGYSDGVYAFGGPHYNLNIRNNLIESRCDGIMGSGHVTVEDNRIVVLTSPAPDYPPGPWQPAAGINCSFSGSISRNSIRITNTSDNDPIAGVLFSTGSLHAPAFTDNTIWVETQGTGNIYGIKQVGTPSIEAISDPIDLAVSGGSIRLIAPIGTAKYYIYLGIDGTFGTQAAVVSGTAGINALSLLQGDVRFLPTNYNFNVGEVGVNITRLVNALLNPIDPDVMRDGFVEWFESEHSTVTTINTNITSPVYGLPVIKTAIDDIETGGGGAPVGPGADQVTLTFTNTDTGLPIADADVWVSADAAGNTVIAGTLQTNSLGQATFLLTDGLSYYAWLQKDGVNSILGQSFVAEED